MPQPAGAGDLTLDSGDLAGAGQGGGEGTDNLARLMAKAITGAVVNPAPGAEGATLQPIEGEPASIIVEPTPEEKAAQEAAAAAAAAAAPVVEEGGEPLPPIEEIEGALAEAGIDLGISAKDLPKELLPVYQKLVESAVDVAQNILSRELEAS